jgi:hypothetical protein
VLTLGDAATRFMMCTGSHSPVLVDDSTRAAQPISQALTHTRLQPLAVGRAHRFATRAQRIALAVRDGGCILCGRPPAECQTHHVTPWSEGGRTDLDELVLVCWSHHREVDLNRWRITRNPNTEPDQPHWLITPNPPPPMAKANPHTGAQQSPTRLPSQKELTGQATSGSPRGSMSHLDTPSRHRQERNCDAYA